MASDESFNIDKLVARFEDCAETLKATGDVDVNKYALGVREIKKVLDIWIFLHFQVTKPR